LLAEIAAAALRGKKNFEIKKHFDFRCLRAHGESIRRLFLTFISITTNSATVSLNKGAF
jgi:hypothetical protein